MSLSVKLDAFEGPLDLLLHLIEKNKINIYDIPIVDITEQYLEYVNLMEEQDLNLISEFLVMASTLLDIKSRMLLPKQDDDECEEDDPRQDLVERLLEYKLYKYISFELKDRKIDANRTIFKEATIPVEVSGYEEPVDLDKLIGDLTLGKLNDIFNEVMRRQVNKLDKIRSNFGNIEKDEVNLTDKIDEIIHYISKYKEISFKELLLKQRSKMNIIVSFLAILELIKLGKISIVQENIFDDITITEA